MTNKIVAVQGNNPSKLNPVTDTSVFLAHEIQNKKYKYFITTLKIYLLLIPKLLQLVVLLNLITKIKNFLKF
jgi:glutathione synthase